MRYVFFAVIYLYFQGLPNLSTIATDEEVVSLNHKLVRFDCIISDMFEEEYFVSVLRGTPETQPIIYKYYSNVRDEHTELLHSTQPNATNTIERGNVLGSTVVSQSPWTAPMQ